MIEESDEDAEDASQLERVLLYTGYLRITCAESHIV